MDLVSIVVLWSLVAFGVQLVVHRLMYRYKKILLLASVSYFLAIPLVITKQLITPSSGMQLVVTACMLSFIIGTIVFLFYSPRLLEGQTPSTTLFRAFSKREQWRKKELINLFTEQELINVRLATLEKYHLIKRHDGMFVITRRGKIIYSVLSWIAYCVRVEVGG